MVQSSRRQHPPPSYRLQLQFLPTLRRLRPRRLPHTSRGLCQRQLRHPRLCSRGCSPSQQWFRPPRRGPWQRQRGTLWRPRSLPHSNRRGQEQRLSAQWGRLPLEPRHSLRAHRPRPPPRRCRRRHLWGRAAARAAGSLGLVPRSWRRRARRRASRGSVRSKRPRPARRASRASRRASASPGHHPASPRRCQARRRGTRLREAPRRSLAARLHARVRCHRGRRQWRRTTSTTSGHRCRCGPGAGCLGQGQTAGRRRRTLRR